MRRPGHWPTPTALGLLRAALWDGEDAARAWRRVLATADIETLDGGSARLLPLVQHNVRRLGLDDPWQSRIKGIHRYWFAHNRLLHRLGSTALAELERAAIPTIVLKGLPLGVVYYGDPALRPMSDVDVLVPRATVGDALDSLARVGWAPEKRVDSDHVRLLHGVSLHDRRGHTVDLHWAIHEDDVRPGADDAAWATARPIEVDGAATRMLAPAPLLVHCLSSGAKWAGDPSVRWVADATLIIRRGNVDWHDFVTEVVERRYVVRVRACLEYLSAAMGVVVPESVMTALAAQPTSAFERLEHQLRTRTYARLGELPRYWLAWSRGGAAAWRDPLDFGNYLRCVWDLPSRDALPAAAFERAARRLRAG